MYSKRSAQMPLVFFCAKTSAASMLPALEHAAFTRSRWGLVSVDGILNTACALMTVSYTHLITVAPKGAGSENKGQLKRLTPSDGLEGVKDFVVQCVKEAGGSPCPPIIVGVGLGGTMEKAALLSKHALLREVGQPNPEPQAAQIEAELLERINALGIGPQGVGGRTTAMAVHLEVSPTHIACLPVAVSIQCNAARHASATLHMQDVKEEG